ncbi:MAG: AraC family ligand binding domain-containing protein [Bacteroidales bacterium]|nr:AraC family ligand binding domain-containing protein [Bacteroidales bacterium]
MKRLLISVLVAFSTLIFINGQGDAGLSGTDNSSVINIDRLEEILCDWAGAYSDKNGTDFSDTLHFHLAGSDHYRYIVFSDGDYTLYEGMHPDAVLIFTASLDTYNRIYRGEMSGMTAVGRANITEPAPLDIILANGMTLGKVNWEWAYYTLGNFFNIHPANRTLLGIEHSRKVHGGNAVALFYSVGYRSAWYHIGRGEMLNESGERDPFNQSFVILSGSGTAKIGNDTIQLRENEAYYIRPMQEHKVWSDTEKGITLLWNAWGSEAW